MKLRTFALTALAVSPLLMASSCMPTPGWDGSGTAVEVEFIAPEREASTVDADGLEVTVMLGNGQEGNAMFEPSQKCAEKIVLGRNYTLAEVEKHCGPAGFSTDD